MNTSYERTIEGRWSVPRDRLLIEAFAPQAEADECTTWHQRASMNMVVHIPYRAEEDRARALSLAQQAPTFTNEWVDNSKVTAIFFSLPRGIETAVRPVGEAMGLSGAWASINSKRISSLTKLRQRLNCYRDSLNAPDRERYCPEKTAFFNSLVGCEGYRSPVPCQFICTPCLRMTQDQSTIDVGNRFEVATELEEIAWCPNLKMSGSGSQTGRALLTIDPGSTKG